MAVVKTYIEREGQQTVEGTELPIRRNHSLKVVVKRDGQWLIVSEMYMDARDEQTLVHQSPTETRLTSGLPLPQSRRRIAPAARSAIG